MKNSPAKDAKDAIKTAVTLNFLDPSLQPILNQNDNPYRHNLKNRDFRGIPTCFDPLGLTGNQEKILQHIIKRSYNNNIYRAKLDDIANQLKMSKSTVRRAIKKLVEYGLVSIDRFDRGLKFVLTEFFKRMENVIKLFGVQTIDKLKQFYDQLLAEYEHLKNTYSDRENDRQNSERMFKMNTLSVQNEHSHLNIIEKDQKKDHTQHTSEQPPRQPKTIIDKPSHHPVSQGSFSDYQNVDFDGLENEIRESSNEIKKLPKKKIPFAPMGMSVTMLAIGIPAKAVSRALKSMVKDWDIIDINPIKFFEKRCKRHAEWMINEKQIENARRAELENEQRKKAEQLWLDENGFDF